MNIVIIGFDYTLAGKIAYKLANLVNYKFYNGDKMVRSELINTIDLPIKKSYQEMTNIEQTILTKLSKLKDSIISLDVNSYISNDNFEIFQSSYVVLIKKSSSDNIQVQLEKLISTKAKLVVDGAETSPEKLKNLIF